MSFGYIYIYSGTTLARPPTGRHSICRVAGLGWSRHTCISRSLHFYNYFLDWKLFSFVLRGAICLVSLLYYKFTQRKKSMSAVQIPAKFTVWVCCVTLALTARALTRTSLTISVPTSDVLTSDLMLREISDV